MILGLATSGLVVQLTGVHGGAARPLVELLLQAPGPDGGPPPPLVVAFDPEEVLRAPVGARVLLVEPGPHAAWLNLHRPLVRDRRWTLLLWCTDQCRQRLNREAPDFADWISHRVEVPAFLPAYVEEALAACRQDRTILALVHAPTVPEGWTRVDAAMGWDRIATLAEQRPIWVVGVDELTSWANLRLALSKKREHQGVVLADPTVVSDATEVLDARLPSWKEATTQTGLSAIDAALADLGGAASQPHPAELTFVREPRMWSGLLELLRQSNGPVPPPHDLVEAIITGLDADIATDRQAGHLRAVAQWLRVKATLLVRFGAELPLASTAVREAIHIFTRLRETALRASSQVIEAQILMAQGDLDTAENALRYAAIPDLDPAELVHGRSVLASLLSSRGRPEDLPELRSLLRWCLEQPNLDHYADRSELEALLRRVETPDHAG